MAQQSVAARFTSPGQEDAWAATWAAALESAALQWHSLDPLDQEVFHLEWFGVVEPRLAALRQSVGPRSVAVVRLESARERHARFLGQVAAAD